ncbi:hypothetical protein CHS0354_026983 [Potamilus streckersoni]|uniref:Uncharacterized protein n=1 Tax=Potamilus streckersoni TaxID=2493646 RepID=A0AAE0SC42_9BIVA|nr:hypothetical protein CHS0354_026983 [Potamilus streckersoni]
MPSFQDAIKTQQKPDRLLALKRHNRDEGRQPATEKEVKELRKKSWRCSVEKELRHVTFTWTTAGCKAADNSEMPRVPIVGRTKIAREVGLNNHIMPKGIPWYAYLK